MGKFDEALSVCLNAKEVLYKNDANLMDDLTLSTLQIVFQRLNRCKYLLHVYVSIFVMSSFLFKKNLCVISGLGYFLL